MEDEWPQALEPRVYVGVAGAAHRTFVYARTRWYERLSDEASGAVEFTPVADSDAGLRSWLAESSPDADIDERDDDFAATVREEFVNETPLDLDQNASEFLDESP
jgi:hypothetical protein